MDKLIERIESASGPVLLTNPEICPGTYVLDLYCRYENPAHGWDEFPHQVSGVETGAGARRVARSRGWRVHRDGTATCPKCVRALRAHEVHTKEASSGDD